MKYAACADQHYDANTGTCAQVVFIQPPTLLPELSATDAAPIAGAILAVCATAWGIKTIVRFIRSS